MRSSLICRNLSGLALSLGVWGNCAYGQMGSAGQFQITETGGAAYSLPLQIPPGIGGMEPKLSLNYSSQAANGLLGIGWGLGGLGGIARCPRTMAQDGVRGSVNYDLNDRYCLDGQRLIAVSGVDGGDGTEYRTERESFAKIVSYGVAGNGPAWFKVWTKAGQAMSYGSTTDSRIEAQGKASIRIWALSRIEDTLSNQIAVSYTKDAANGAYYPDRIDYGGNGKSGQRPASSVQFVFSERADAISTFVGGSVVKNMLRMTEIRTYTGGNQVKSYALKYKDVSASTEKRSLLVEVDECDSLGICLQPTTFSWPASRKNSLNTAQRWSSDFAKTQGWTDEANWPRYVIDVNGDGLPDVLGFDSDGVYVGLNTGSAFQVKQKWISDFGRNQGWLDKNKWPRYVIDMNGDGLPDLIGFDSDGVYVALNSGAGFQARTRWLADYGSNAGGWSDETKWPRLLADVNGDGLPDIVGFDSDGVYVALNTGTGFLSKSKWVSGFGTNNGWTDNNKWPRYVIDVNGDGLDDLVGFDSDGVYVALSTGTSFQDRTRWSAEFGASAGGWSDDTKWPRMLIDVNGDGLPDIVGFDSDGVYVAFNTGTVFQPKVRWLSDFGRNQGWLDNDKWPRTMADMDGDGLPDVVGFDADGLYVSLNTGTSFQPRVRWLADFGTNASWVNAATMPRYPRTLNASTATSILGFKDDGIYVATPDAGTVPDRITAIAQSSRTYKLEYKTLTGNGSFYLKDSGSDKAVYPRQDVIYPLALVGTVTISSGADNVTTTSYSYGGLKAELGTGRGMLGLRWMRVQQVETGLTSYTEYQQVWPYTGLPSLVKKSIVGGGNAGVLSQALTTYGCNDAAVIGATPCTVTPGKRYFVYARQNVESSWDYNGAALPVVTTKTEYDSWGNATKVDVATDDGFKKTTINSYSNDSANWYLGRLLKSSVSSVAP